MAWVLGKPLAFPLAPQGEPLETADIVNRRAAAVLPFYIVISKVVVEGKIRTTARVVLVVVRILL